MKTAALFVSVLAFGCVDSGSDIEPDIDVLPKLATNALTPAQLAGASFNATVLNQAILNTYASTQNGRASLPYVVGCALASGSSVTAYYTVSGIPAQQTYQGEIGLATNWTSAALSTQQQALVSGCVLARVNLTGTSVTVSLRGPSAALNVTGTEASQYIKLEGGFFGNIFQGTSFYLGACKGTATAPANRRCAQPTGLDINTECGFSYAGPCADVCSSGSYLTDCLGSNGTVYGDVVTTYLK